MFETWRNAANELRNEVHAMYFACRDPRVPWLAKVLAAGVVAYAFSPIDLIPDFIPVLGYLDDIVIIPIAILAARAMIPSTVMVECRELALAAQKRPKSWIAAIVIVGIWVVAAAMAVVWVVG